MQFHQNSGCLHGRRRAAAILAREIGESEFLGAAALPQKIRFDAARYRFGLGEQLQGTGIRIAMGTTTTVAERQKYRELGVTIFLAAP